MDKIQRGRHLVARVLLIIAAATGFAACGGGGSGSGGGSSAQALELRAEPSFGTVTMAGGIGVTQSVTALPATLASPFVGPANFASATGTDGNFFAFQFSEDVSLASVLGGGISVKGSANNIISFFVDTVGAIDPSNAVDAANPDAAPALLRIYFDMGIPGVPSPLPTDVYTVRLSRELLKSAAGEQFCSIEDGGVCANVSDGVFTFSVSPMAAPPLGNLDTGPTAVLPLPSILTPGEDIRLFFDTAVDFESFVGFSLTTGLPNVTTQDPFCSVPFSMAAMAGAQNSNVLVTYTPPAPTVLPINFGYILYMPNPFTDPTEVCIRFVDMTTSSALDDPTGMFSPLPTFQNYAIPSAVWANSDQTALAASPYTAPRDISTAQNGLLELPPALPLPGTTAAGPATIQIILLSSSNPGAIDSSAVIPANADGITGITDRFRRPLLTDVVIARTLATGTPIANNVEPPDLNIVANGPVLDGYSTASNTINAVPGGIVSGDLFPIAFPIDDINVLANVNDVIMGAFINPANSIANAPRRANRALAIQIGLNNIANGLPGFGAGEPFPPGANPESAVFPPPIPQPMQPLGVRLYVADTVSNEIRVFNSNTFQPLGIVPGVASPQGLGGGGGIMYVSNFSQDTVQRFGLIPGTPQFHTVFGTTSVGAGPTAVSFQEDGEDILVINSLGSSMSIIDVPSYTERVQLPVGQGPTEITVSNRWTGMGTTFAYQAYVTNTLSNTVSIYESDSPLQTVPNGPQGKIIEERSGFSGPAYGSWTRTLGAFNGIGAQGMYVANSLGNSVTYMGMTSFNLAPNPGFPGPPPTRVFNTIVEYVGSGSVFGTGPTDVEIDATTFAFTNPPIINSLLVSFPGAGRIASFGAANGVLVGTAAIPGNKIFTVFSQ